MRRGDIVSVATGSGFGGKPRPALILQTDAHADLDTVIVALITSELEDAPISRPLVQPDAHNKLHLPSHVMIDIVVTAHRDKIGYVIGRLSAPDMAQVQQALLVILGLA